VILVTAAELRYVRVVGDCEAVSGTSSRRVAERMYLPVVSEYASTR